MKSQTKAPKESNQRLTVDILGICDPVETVIKLTTKID